MITKGAHLYFQNVWQSSDEASDQLLETMGLLFQLVLTGNDSLVKKKKKVDAHDPEQDNVFFIVFFNKYFTTFHMLSLESHKLRHTDLTYRSNK